MAKETRMRRHIKAEARALISRLPAHYLEAVAIVIETAEVAEDYVYDGERERRVESGQQTLDDLAAVVRSFKNSV